MASQNELKIKVNIQSSTIQRTEFPLNFYGCLCAFPRLICILFCKEQFVWNFIYFTIWIYEVICETRSENNMQPFSNLSVEIQF